MPARDLNRGINRAQFSVAANDVFNGLVEPGIRFRGGVAPTVGFIADDAKLAIKAHLLVELCRLPVSMPARTTSAATVSSASRLTMTCVRSFTPDGPSAAKKAPTRSFRRRSMAR